MGLMRTVEMRMAEANRDNDSVYMQPKVPVARLPPIAMHNMAKVCVHFVRPCIVCCCW